MRGTHTGDSNAYDRGLAAEEAFRKLLGATAIRSGKYSDRLDHWDLSVKFDIKKIRSSDEFGESTYHWVELMNVNGNKGWLYGEADYFAFETSRHWVIVDANVLRDYILIEVTNTEIVSQKVPYRVYRRVGRFDKVVMIPTLDLCALGFMVKK